MNNIAILKANRPAAPVDQAQVAIDSIADEHSLGAVLRSLWGLAGGVLNVLAHRLVTLWVLIQGFRIVTGRSRDSMMAMVTDMTRIAIIVAAATTMAVGSVDIQRFFSEDLPRGINGLVTGNNESPASNIDKNLAYTQLAMGAIEAAPPPDTDVANSAAQSRATFIATLGIAGPPMTAGAMLLMFQVALALFIGLGPLFILCLIFEQTKSFFSRWLMYGLSTLFSLAVLNFMVSIVLELTLRVAAAMWSARIIQAITDTNSEGFTNMALQQGGIGLLMTVLLVSTPPMAAAFFGGTLGNFYAFSQMGGASKGASSQWGPGGQAPGSYGGGGGSPQAVDRRIEQAPQSQSGLGQTLGGRTSTEPPRDEIRPASVPSKQLKVDGEP